MVALFIVPNVVVVSAVEFDMNKYFQIMWIAVAILAAWLIRRWPTAGDRRRARGLAPCRPCSSRVWHLRSTRRGARACPRRRPRRWIAANTPERSRVRHRRLHQQPGRPRRAAAHHDLRAVRRRTSATTRRRARPTRTAIYCDGPDVGGRAAWRCTARPTCCRAAACQCDDGTGHRLRVEPAFETVYDEDGVIDLAAARAVTARRARDAGRSALRLDDDRDLGGHARRRP